LVAAVTVLTAVAAGLVAVLVIAGLVAAATVLTAAAAGLVAALVIAGVAAVLTALTAVAAGAAVVLAGAAAVVAAFTTVAAGAGVDPPAATDDTAFDTAPPGLTEGVALAAVGTLETPPRVTAAAAPLGTARTANSRATAVIQRILKLQTSPTRVVRLPRNRKNLPIF
jgi:hypothetical protein